MNIEQLKNYVMDLTKAIEGNFDWTPNSLMTNIYGFYFASAYGDCETLAKETYISTFDLTEKQFHFIYGDGHFNLNQTNLEKWLEKILILLNRNKLNDLVKGLSYIAKLTTEEAVDKPVNEMLENLITPDLDQKFWGNFLEMEKPELMPYLHEEFSLSVKEVNEIFWSDGITEDSTQLMIKNINTIIAKEI